jgi:hypothetical protein
MNGEQLERVLRACSATSRAFLGVYARDTVLDALSRPAVAPAFVVANVADSSDDGLHWVLMFRGDDARAYFVDSLARAPAFYGMDEAARALAAEFRQCPYALQADTSNVCGLYCTYFAVRLCEGASFDDVNARFSPTDRYGNDAAVVAWTKKRFRLDATTTTTTGQTSRRPDDINYYYFQ